MMWPLLHVELANEKSWSGRPRCVRKALQQPLAREMDFTGRSTRGMVYVDSDVISEDETLGHGCFGVPDLIQMSRMKISFSSASIPARSWQRIESDDAETLQDSLSIPRGSSSTRTRWTRISGLQGSSQRIDRPPVRPAS
jgi:hypothetical protein